MVVVRPEAREIGASGLTANEEAVLALFDAGERDADAIADSVGCSLRLVRWILAAYAQDPLAAQRSFERRARHASQALAAAIAATGKVWA